jgi:uncharacterized protein (TIGR03086 family)
VKIGRRSGLYNVMSLPPGAMALLAGAVSYALSVCALVTPGDLELPTPCTEWDLGMLLAHLSTSMADLEAAISTGQLDLGPVPDMAAAPDMATADPVELIRDRAAGLLCAAYGYAGPERFVTVGGLPLPAGLVACTGAVEIAVHGWDVAAARGRAGRSGSAGRGGSAGCGGGDPKTAQTPIAPIPAALATRLLTVCPLLVAGREGLFALPVEVPAQASPGDQLVGYLGRDPGPGRLAAPARPRNSPAGPGVVTGE